MAFKNRMRLGWPAPTMVCVNGFGDRGQHVVSFSERLDARLIMDAYLRSVWGSDGFPGKICGLSLREIRDEMHGGRAVWAPDGDEAFDDHSFVLQFDVGTRVRAIAFRMGADACPPGSGSRCMKHGWT